MAVVQKPRKAWLIGDMMNLEALDSAIPRPTATMSTGATPAPGTGAREVRLTASVVPELDGARGLKAQTEVSRGRDYDSNKHVLRTVNPNPVDSRQQYEKKGKERSSKAKPTTMRKVIMRERVQKWLRHEVLQRIIDRAVAAVETPELKQLPVIAHNEQPVDIGVSASDPEAADDLNVAVRTSDSVQDGLADNALDSASSLQAQTVKVAAISLASSSNAVRGPVDLPAHGPQVSAQSHHIEHKSVPPAATTALAASAKLPPMRGNWLALFKPEYQGGVDERKHLEDDRTLTRAADTDTDRDQLLSPEVKPSSVSLQASDSTVSVKKRKPMSRAQFVHEHHATLQSNCPFLS